MEFHEVGQSKVPEVWLVSTHLAPLRLFSTVPCFVVIPHKYAHKNDQLWNSIDFILYTALHIKNNPHCSHSATLADQYKI